MTLKQRRRIAEALTMIARKARQKFEATVLSQVVFTANIYHFPKKKRIHTNSSIYLRIVKRNQ